MPASAPHHPNQHDIIPTMTSPFDFSPFAARRQRLIERLNAAGGGVAVIATAAEVARNRDTHYPYRYDSYFHYLTGFG